MFTPDKRPNEEEWYAFEFAPALAVGEELISADPEIRIKKGAERDPLPLDLTVDQVVVSGTKVLLHVIGGADGATYIIICTVNTDGDQRLTEFDYLKVKEPK